MQNAFHEPDAPVGQNFEGAKAGISRNGVPVQGNFSPLRSRYLSAHEAIVGAGGALP